MWDDESSILNLRRVSCDSLVIAGGSIVGRNAAVISQDGWRLLNWFFKCLYILILTSFFFYSFVLKNCFSCRCCRCRLCVYFLPAILHKTLGEDIVRCLQHNFRLLTPEWLRLLMREKKNEGQLYVSLFD